jgi:hypothetical protein
MDGSVLLQELRRHGLRLQPKPGGILYVEPVSLLTDALREQIRHHKAALLKALARSSTQWGLFSIGQKLPPPPGPFPDAAYHKARFDQTMAKWQRKEWGPCANCGQITWYEHMGFSHCGVCTPQRREEVQEDG